MRVVMDAYINVCAHVKGYFGAIGALVNSLDHTGTSHTHTRAHIHTHTQKQRHRHTHALRVYAQTYTHMHQTTTHMHITHTHTPVTWISPWPANSSSLIHITRNIQRGHRTSCVTEHAYEYPDPILRLSNRPRFQRHHTFLSTCSENQYISLLGFIA